MKFLEKFKLLFKIRKPAGQIVEQLKNVKRGWKTIAFWVTMVGSLGATAGALTGILPPMAQLAATTILTTIYNILRGAQKMDEPSVRGTFRTTEFLVTSLGELQKGIVAAQTGGINPEWMAIASTVVGAAFAAGQQLSAQSSKPAEPTTNNQ